MARFMEYSSASSNRRHTCRYPATRMPFLRTEKEKIREIERSQGGHRHCAPLCPLAQSRLYAALERPGGFLAGVSYYRDRVPAAGLGYLALGGAGWPGGGHWHAALCPAQSGRGSLD